MKKEWFEPGPDGVSPFERLSATVGFGAAGTAAAFRALLAEDEQAAPVVNVDLSSQPDVTRAVQLDDDGNVLQEVTVTHDGGQVFSVQAAPVELPALVAAGVNDKHADEAEHVENYVAKAMNSKDDEITGLRAEVERLTAELRTCADERMAAEIEGDAADVIRIECDVLQAYFLDEQVKCASIESELVACRESRDALQARIDAGVPMRGIRVEGSGYYIDSDDDKIMSILIDAHPLNHIVEPNKMVDERKGERRQIKPRHDDPFRRYADSDRRRTAGTIDDRKGN